MTGVPALAPLGLLCLIVLTTSSHLPWTLQMKNMKFRTYTSQMEQDGVLEYIFHHIGVTNKFYVEFGFNSDDWVGGSGANSYNLMKHYGWSGLLLDGGHQNASINLRKEFIYPANISDVFRKHSVPIVFDFLSVDIDSVDLWVLRSILKAGYRPRVITAEFNHHFPFETYLTFGLHNDIVGHVGDRAYGASIRAYDLLAKEFGYTIVYIVHALDVVLVDIKELKHAPSIAIEYFEPEAGYRGPPHHGNHAPMRPEHRHYIWCYKTWQETGNATLAREVAQVLLTKHIDFINGCPKCGR